MNDQQAGEPTPMQRASAVRSAHQAELMAGVSQAVVSKILANDKFYDITGFGYATDAAYNPVRDMITAVGIDVEHDFAPAYQLMPAKRKVIGEIRAGSGPQFLEVMTYRFRGHSMGDPERYRKAEEVHKWQEEDPIGIFRKYILDHNIASEVELNTLDDKAMEIVVDAAEFAEK